jgi:hypothetical protein
LCPETVIIIRRKRAFVVEGKIKIIIIILLLLNRSQTHEFGNWDSGRAIPFLGIFVSNFQYWFFAVCSYDG